ncbi:MAG: aminodeoxychorismate/anthranilate synthase component II [Candidatus Zixiibacteriota bacterium]
MILVIDNYDSFTYNLVQYFGVLTSDVSVVRPHEVTVDDIAGMQPQRIVISPGPGHPDQAKLSTEVISRFHGELPILGVCLGHQCIGAAFGAEIRVAERLVHGKTSEIYHKGKGILAGLPNPFRATRYHSLVVAEETLPDSLEVTAYTSDGEVMGLQHRTSPLFGVQFHPESILTREGMRILSSFLEVSP